MNDSTLKNKSISTSKYKDKILITTYLDNKTVMLYTEIIDRKKSKYQDTIHKSFHNKDVYIDYFKTNAEYKDRIKEINKDKEEHNWLKYDLKRLTIDEAKVYYWAGKEIYLLPNMIDYCDLNLPSSYFLKISRSLYRQSLFTPLIKNICQKYNCTKTEILFLTKDDFVLEQKQIRKRIEEISEKKMIKNIFITDNPQNKYTFGIKKDNEQYYFKEYNATKGTVYYTRNIVKSKLFEFKTDVKKYLDFLSEAHPEILKNMNDTSENCITITKVRIANQEKYE